MHKQTEIGQRVIQVEGAYNVRDLGGYKTKDGRTTRWGVFLRADGLHRLGEAGRQLLIDRGLRTVIDLRYSRELAEKKDVFADSSVVDYRHISLMTPEASDRIHHLGKLYIDILDGSQAELLQVFELLADPAGHTALFHCTAGKDRTGTVAALLLELAGVPHETIVEDYALTAVCIAPIMDELRQGRPATVSEELYEINLGCEPMNMRDMLNHLKRQYGDAEGYLLSIGLTEEQIRSLKHRLIEANEHEGTRKETPGMKLTVMTFNLRTSTASDGDHAWRYRRDKAAHIIREHAPDLIGTQEGREHMLAELRLEAYDWVGAGRRGDHEDEHCAIFYKKEKLELIAQGTFWLSETPELAASRSWDSSLPRICTWAQLREKATGAQVMVFNTHLDHRGPIARQKGMELVWSRIQEMRREKPIPVILTGDFNSYPVEPAVRMMRGEIAIREDKFVQMQDVYAVMDNVGPSANPEFSGIQEGEPIDYIFVTPEVQIVSAEIDRRTINGMFPSDHYPVIARLHIVPPAASSV